MIVTPTTAYGRQALILTLDAESEDECRAVMERARLAHLQTHGQTARSWSQDYDTGRWNGRVYLLEHGREMMAIIAEGRP